METKSDLISDVDRRYDAVVGAYLYFTKVINGGTCVGLYSAIKNLRAMNPSLEIAEIARAYRRNICGESTYVL